MSDFHAISPLDGRYRQKLAHLSDYFSEFALMRSRVQVELRYLLVLDAAGLFAPLNHAEKQAIERQLDQFTDEDYRQIKEIESRINHDVKACEMFLRETLGLRQPNMIHFGLTSEDVNNLAYTLLLKEYLEREQLPQLRSLLEQLATLAESWCAVPFPARTHGQMASPTTGGKEMAVYINRLLRVYRFLRAFRFRGKLNGATGNFSALVAAFPQYDWIEFSRQFLQSLDLEYNPATTQIEDHDTWGAYFAIVRQLNNILLDFDRDMWLYLTLGYLVMEADAGAVGSSTMPHKVNPINFENSEGNLQISVALLNGITDKLGNSRLQRDLSDSTVERNKGV
ncbi:MAG TPA: adenylosuccinate lyase, partial [Caldithrix abyssi]|nr:adenylosuccinate lyase [Caldithrix abyssi]